MKPIDMMTRRLRIFGTVQGVGYRDALRFEAERRALTGWVRNRIDGSVEALIQGTPEALDALIAWARRGPRAAHVVDLRIELPDDTTRYSEFERRPTI
jgi:acylphosphatase